MGAARPSSPSALASSVGVLIATASANTELSISVEECAALFATGLGFRVGGCNKLFGAASQSPKVDGVINTIGTEWENVAPRRCPVGCVLDADVVEIIAAEVDRKGWEGWYRRQSCSGLFTTSLGFRIGGCERLYTYTVPCRTGCSV